MSKEGFEELKLLKQEIDKDKKIRLIDKILESQKMENIINKVTDFYHNTTEKIFNKYNLHDELKQGKIFMILVGFLAFLLLVVITLFFGITLNSLLGVNLLFAFIRSTIFCFKWGYTIIKNKGNLIKKYLINLFPNSKILESKKEIENEQISIFADTVLEQVKKIIDNIENEKLDTNIKKEIILKLKNIVDKVRINDLSFEDDANSYALKKEICNNLAEIEFLIDKYTKEKQLNDNLVIKQEEIQEKLDDMKILILKK